LSSWGFIGWVNGQLYKRVGFTRVLFGNEFPFFVERLYEEKFMWGWWGGGVERFQEIWQRYFYNT
jgi:hypothetical protein